VPTWQAHAPWRHRDEYCLVSNTISTTGKVAERLGADIERVRIGIGSDPRIGFQFIWPGCGYGGSCFPKDVQALVRTAQQAGYMPELLQAVEAVTQFQKQRLHGLISSHFGGAKGLAGRRFALWGLAFKPNTDDMRDAPAWLPTTPKLPRKLSGFIRRPSPMVG